MEFESNRRVDREETHLSGAYIRSLVKQLSSSRTKDTVNPNDPDPVLGDSPKKLTKKMSDKISETSRTQKIQQPQPHKKQVRRRLHTTRPYQERLLNMAEARREIVTALKFHRAAMKQASEQKEKQLQEQRQPASVVFPQQTYIEQEEKMRSRRNPRIYPSSSPNFSNYMNNFPSTSFSASSDPLSWPCSQIPPPSLPEVLNFPLPDQPLGLNLNFQDFSNIETSLYHNSSIYSSSSSSSSSSPSMISVASEEVPSVGLAQDFGPTVAAEGLHQVMDDEGMAEIRSIGEQHQMEWDDAMNLVTSAWWFKFLKTVELGPEVKSEDYDGSHPFDEVMEFPSWLNPNESYLEPCTVDYSSQVCFQDPALPCMDIGEIEGMDEDWLA